MSNGVAPIQPAPVPPSIAGIPQPVFGSGSATTPATPIPITGSPILPPPLITNPPGTPVFPPTGGNQAPVAVPVGPLVGPAVAPAPVPPSQAGFPQPRYQTGSGTVPTAASLFPAFTTGGPQQPIVLTNIFKIGTVPPPLPTTPGVQPILISTVPTIPQLPWTPPSTRPPTPLPPVNQTAPTATILTGGGAVGSNIANASPGIWSPPASGGYTRQWYSGGSPIPGATATTYTAQASDIGNQIYVRVTGSNPDGSGFANSNTVGPITDLLEEEAPAQDEPETRAAPRATPKRRKR